METISLLHNAFCVVGDDYLPDGVAVIQLYVAEFAPVSMYLLYKRQCLLPAVELSIAA